MSCILTVKPVSVAERRGPNVLGVETCSPWYELAALKRRPLEGIVTESGKRVGIEGKVSLEKLSEVTVRLDGERKGGGKGEVKVGMLRVVASDRSSTSATSAARSPATSSSSCSTTASSSRDDASS